MSEEESRIKNEINSEDLDTTVPSPFSFGHSNARIAQAPQNEDSYGTFHDAESPSPDRSFSKKEKKLTGASLKALQLVIFLVAFN